MIDSDMTDSGFEGDCLILWISNDVITVCGVKEGVFTICPGLKETRPLMLPKYRVPSEEFNPDLKLYCLRTILLLGKAS